jgi:hypothetical protein
MLNFGCPALPQPDHACCPIIMLDCQHRRNRRHLPKSRYLLPPVTAPWLFTRVSLRAKASSHAFCSSLCLVWGPKVMGLLNKSSRLIGSRRRGRWTGLYRLRLSFCFCFCHKAKGVKVRALTTMNILLSLVATVVPYHADQRERYIVHCTSCIRLSTRS